MKDLIDLKQVRTLESYIHDFDVLWNKAGIGERQALVIFLEGLELEIKNTLKMFEPKDLRQANNLARLHANTLTHRQTFVYLLKHSISITSHSLPPKPYNNQTLLLPTYQKVTLPIGQTTLLQTHSTRLSLNPPNL
jgi:hypothetical protein